jgi:hypothetical protein
VALEASSVLKERVVLTELNVSFTSMAAGMERVLTGIDHNHIDVVVKTLTNCRQVYNSRDIDA